MKPSTEVLLCNIAKYITFPSAFKRLQKLSPQTRMQARAVFKAAVSKRTRHVAFPRTQGERTGNARARVGEDARRRHVSRAPTAGSGGLKSCHSIWAHLAKLRLQSGWSKPINCYQTRVSSSCPQTHPGLQASVGLGTKENTCSWKTRC